jgi:hypothetical protein
MRNSITHMDKRILTGLFTTGRPIALNPCDAGVEIDGELLRWEELTRWLRELHIVGLRIARQPWRAMKRVSSDVTT